MTDRNGGEVESTGGRMSPPQADRSVFRRLAFITTLTAVSVLLILTVFFALTVNPHFESPELNHRLRSAHFALIGPVLVLVVAVILIAHHRLRRLLLPLRALGDGVARLSRGDLDVSIPPSSRDEFAALTDAFNRMVTRVREMLASREQLLTDVSHELRSPITRMKVALELLPESEPRTRLMADVRELEVLVTEVLELQRLQSVHGIHKEPVDLVLLAENVVASFRDSRPAVTLEAAERPLPAAVDARLLTVVLRNLIENAVTHSLPDSGPVTVRLNRTSDGLVVRVEDDGPGIPGEEADKVFEPFYRLDRSRSRQTGGYGLGLSICKRALAAHGGRLTVERNRPRGSIFVIELP
jgi:signal transduction histidine kinase